MYQVRRVLAHQAALLEGRHHQWNIALLQVAHAPMHQLGTAAAGALAKVIGFDQYHAQTASRSIDRHSHTRSSTTKNGYIPGLLSVPELLHHLFPAHFLLLTDYSFQLLDRSTALCQR